MEGFEATKNSRGYYPLAEMPMSKFNQFPFHCHSTTFGWDFLNFQGKFLGEHWVMLWKSSKLERLFCEVPSVRTILDIIYTFII